MNPILLFFPCYTIVILGLGSLIEAGKFNTWAGWGLLGEAIVFGAIVLTAALIDRPPHTAKGAGE